MRSGRHTGGAQTPSTAANRRPFRLGLLLALLLMLLAPAALLAQAKPANTPAPGTPDDDKIPLRPGTHRLAAYITVDNATLRIPYVLYLPEDFTPSTKMPVLVFLHGMGESGTDLDAIFIHGVQHEIDRADRPDLRRGFPMIVISPQCPPRGQRWDDNTMPKYLDALLDRILPSIPHDADRISCTGLSMGGLATWKAAFVNPQRYAAIAPVSASAWRLDQAGQTLKGVHVLAYCGTGDGDRVTGTHAMAAAIRKAGGDAQSVEIPGGHFIWNYVYEDPRFYDWLVAQRRSKPGPASAPALAQPGPLAPGFQRRTLPVELLGQKFDLSCAVYLPPAYRAGSKYPALLVLADDLQTGAEKDGMALYGPAAEIARGQLKDPFNFVIICPQLLPAICRWDNPQLLAAIEKGLSDAEKTLPIDPRQLYVVGTNLGARGATMLSNRTPGRFLAEIAMLTHPRTAFSDLRGDWMKKQRVMVLATTPLDDGRVQQINAFLQDAAAGSSYTVFPSQPGKIGPFASGKIYQWLLQATPIAH